MTALPLEPIESPNRRIPKIGILIVGIDFDVCTPRSNLCRTKNTSKFHCIVVMDLSSSAS